jgi:hypothetical protein
MMVTQRIKSVVQLFVKIFEVDLAFCIELGHIRDRPAR